MSVSVIIPHRDEGKYLDMTIASARQQYKTAEIIAIEDEPHIGLSYRRHEGIVRANHETIIVSDAHCKFGPGLFREAKKHLKHNQNDVLCFDCRSADQETLDPCGEHRAGAAFMLHDGKNPLALKWRYGEHPPGECPVVLGGVYAFRRTWYLEGLAGIWQYTRGWGHSELLLSLANRQAGGRNYCRSDLSHSHLFRTDRNHHVKPQDIRRNMMIAMYCLLSEKARAKVFEGMGVLNPAPSYGRKQLDAEGVIDRLNLHFSKINAFHME